MADKKSGGISLLTLAFWFWVGWTFFDCDDDKTKVDVAKNDTVVVSEMKDETENNKTEFSEQIKKSIDELKLEMEQLVDEAREEFSKVKTAIKDEIEEKKKKKDKYKSPESEQKIIEYKSDDIYGSSEDRY